MTDKVQKIREEVERIKTNANKRGAISKHSTMVVCDEILSLIDSMQEEPVSEDLEKAAEQDVCEVVNTCSATGIPNDHIPSWVQDAMINEFIHGANWKEQQFEKNRLKHCDSITNEQAELELDFIDQHLDKHQRIPTFLDAIEYGMRLKEEQVKAKAIDAQCFGFQGAALFSFRLPSDKYLVGSNVKVIVIKED